MFHLLCDRPVWNRLGNAFFARLAGSNPASGRDEDLLPRDFRLSDECP
jgi:hypothetical protein